MTCSKMYFVVFFLSWFGFSWEPWTTHHLVHFFLSEWRWKGQDGMRPWNEKSTHEFRAALDDGRGRLTQGPGSPLHWQSSGVLGRRVLVSSRPPRSRLTPLCSPHAQPCLPSILHLKNLHGWQTAAAVNRCAGLGCWEPRVYTVFAGSLLRLCFPISSPD